MVEPAHLLALVAEPAQRRIAAGGLQVRVVDLKKSAV
jgi:hypothetical protein